MHVVRSNKTLNKQRGFVQHFPLFFLLLHMFALHQPLPQDMSTATV